MKLTELANPFAADDIEWRVQQAGARDNKPWAMVLAYVTSRAVQERLDTVCGPHNWCNQFKDAPGGGVLCGISIKCGDEWITKWDGAEQTDIEAVKGGLSGAMKRAAVQWGIGRYLYNLDSGFATIYDGNGRPNKNEGWHYQNANNAKSIPAFYWKPPALPAWALPGNRTQQQTAQQPAPAVDQVNALKVRYDRAKDALLKSMDEEMFEDTVAQIKGKNSKDGKIDYNAVCTELETMVKEYEQ